MTASRRDPHLGELAAALVDGALDHGARDRALAHLTRCDECRAEVDSQRRLKAALASMTAPVVPAGLADRLRQLPDRTPPPTPVGLPADRFGARFRAGARPGTDGRALDGRPLKVVRGDTPPVPLSPSFGVAAPSLHERPAAGRPVPDRPGGGVAAALRRPGGRSRPRRRRLAATAAGGFAAFALTLAAVAAVGGSDDLPPVTPQVGTLTVEHNRQTGGVPATDPEVGVLDATISRR